MRLNKIAFRIFPALLVALVSLVPACGNGGSGTPPGEGRAMSGPVANATVILHRLNGDGSRGEAVQSATSDDNGNFQFHSYQAGPLEIVVTGGSYVDEATGQSVDMTGRELSTLVATYVGQGKGIAVTPLTTAAAIEARLRIAHGESLKSAIEASNADVAVRFGLDGVDITRVVPTDLTDPSETSTAGDPSTTYAVALAALSQTAESYGLSPEQGLLLARNVGEDLSDGSVDNRANGEALSNDLPVTSSRTVNEIERQADNFLASPQNRSGVLLDQVSLKPDLTCPVGMVKFDGAGFIMGNDADDASDNPEHRVTLSDFCIDAKEVTQAQYTAWGGGGRQSELRLSRKPEQSRRARRMAPSPSLLRSVRKAPADGSRMGIRRAERGSGPGGRLRHRRRRRLRHPLPRRQL